jgi:hypothetical protein
VSIDFGADHGAMQAGVPQLRDCAVATGFHGLSINTAAVDDGA